MSIGCWSAFDSEAKNRWGYFYAPVGGFSDVGDGMGCIGEIRASMRSWRSGGNAGKLYQGIPLRKENN
jgi:hypothetical protein